ncbi:MAG: VIT and VWA domain-containing protein [Deltaproteobacteria bacterium]|jgi:Ca-activated chloride channel family protein|nr:VIT and VWA domain-containing protein [Deltaproteobacteria bacterium]
MINSVLSSIFDSYPSLTSLSGLSAALKSARIEGRLNGLILETTLFQSYRNETDENLEIVYTFPVPYGAELLGLKVVVGGQTLQAEVREKARATESYEKAVEDGDGAFLVELAANGLLTANLGNVLPGEEVELALSLGQLLRFDGNRIRLSFPTVVAPLYGDAVSEGGLEPQQVPSTNLLAEYPFTLKINILGKNSEADISSPSHSIDIARREGCATVSIKSEAFLDREFVLILENLPFQSFSLLAEHKEEKVILASFSPTLKAPEEPLAIKALLDCSGSMCGANVELAKSALSSILSLMRPQDYLSLSCFGTNVSHLLKKMTPLTKLNLTRLQTIISGISASMGGTEMYRALESVLGNIKPPSKINVPAKVLIITDGEIWDMENVIELGRQSAHKVFTLGIGCAPGEHLLRSLGVETSGACDFLSYGEDVLGSAERMMTKMRTPETSEVKLTWDREPLWQTPAPASLYQGLTAHVMAGFIESPKRAPILTWKQGGQEYNLSAEEISPVSSPDLARLAGAERLKAASDPEEELRLALDYKLVGPLTSLILVKDRGEDKASSLPSLHRVPHMMASFYSDYGATSEIDEGCGLVDFICDMKPDNTTRDRFSRVLAERALIGNKRDMIHKTESKVLAKLFRAPTNQLRHKRAVGHYFQEVDSLSLANLEFMARETINNLEPDSSWDNLKQILTNSGLLRLLMPIKKKLPKELKANLEQIIALLVLWLREKFKVFFILSRQNLRLVRSQCQDLSEDEKKIVFKHLDALFS